MKKLLFYFGRKLLTVCIAFSLFALVVNPNEVTCAALFPQSQQLITNSRLSQRTLGGKKQNNLVDTIPENQKIIIFLENRVCDTIPEVQKLIFFLENRVCETILEVQK